MPPKSKKRVKECEKIKQSKKAKHNLIVQMYPQPGENPPLAIDFMTFTAKDIPADWGSKKVAEAAAKGNETLARLMGHVTLEYVNVSPATMKLLHAPFSVTEGFRHPFQCNVDGEYTSDGSRNENQIPLTRLMDGVSAATFQVAPDSPTEQLVTHLYALQNPSTSIYDIPYIRLFSRHRYDSKTRQLSVDYYVYFSRLIFVLISDEAIKFIMEHIKVTCEIRPCTPSIPQPPMLNKEHQELLQLKDFRFSLPGLLKHVENTGYGYGLGYPEDSALALRSQEAGKQSFTPPPGLKVSLYDFQKSTYLWMLDQEQDEGGLNGHFWEEWLMTDGGGSLYYFPLGGEFRFDKPPVARGGLLCEEMGLGKTIEVLALILGNPAPPSSLVIPHDPADIISPITKSQRVKPKIPTRATLIIVPGTLAPQWWEEVQKRTTCGGDRDKGEIRALNMVGSNIGCTEIVPSCNIREILYDDEDNVIERKAWGVYSSGSEVEIRHLPYTSKDVIITGTIPWPGYSRAYDIDDIKWDRGRGKFDNIKHLFEGKKSIVGCEVRVELDQCLTDMDIVLTTYNNIRNTKFHKLFQSFRWHRIVLDECQEIKIATNQIAKLCANLTAERRWMVSGTPLVSKIGDIHGELAFLKVWPFCLPNSEDGFWELRVDGPWRRREESALAMLYALLDVVMMRHCKSQRYLTSNAPLVDLPSRTVEWRGFEQRQSNIGLSQGQDKVLFAYEYIEAFAASAMQRFLRTNQLSSDTSHQLWMAAPHASQLKGLYSLLSRCLTHPSAVSLPLLDHLRRMLGDVRGIRLGMHGEEHDNEGSIPVLSPEDILSLVQGITAGQGGATSANHESSRIQASVTAHDAEQQQRETYMAMSVAELTEQVLDLDLPQPISWIALPYRASVCSSSKQLTLYSPVEKIITTAKASKLLASQQQKVKKALEEEVEGEDNDERKEEQVVANISGSKRMSLHDALTIGDIIRLGSSKKEEHEGTIARVMDAHCDPHHHWKGGHRLSSGEQERQRIDDENDSVSLEVEGEIELTDCWASYNQNMAPLYKRSYSTRKVMYVDLLIANAQALNMKQMHATTSAEKLNTTGCRNNSSSGSSSSSPTLRQLPPNGMLHAGGFSTIYKLMAGRTPSCPLCLAAECTRPTVTSCVHVYCLECITSVIRRENNGPMFGGGGRGAKCPVCRRGLTFDSLMEVKEHNLLEDGREEEEKEEEEKEEEEEEDEEEKEEENQLKENKEEKEKEEQGVEGPWAIERNIASPGSDLSFVIPPLDASSTAATTEKIKLAEEYYSRQQLNNFNFRNSMPVQRDTQLPSISPFALSVFRPNDTTTYGQSDNADVPLNLSPRLAALVEDIRQVQKDDPFSKFVVFSQYKESLQVAHKLLNDKRVIEQYDLHQPLHCQLMSTQRGGDNDALKTFYANPTCNVLMLTMGAAATGLTLTMAKTLYILEPSPSAVDEAQAISRIHRIGQRAANIRCVIFFAKRTCEERLLALRQQHHTLSEILSSNQYSVSEESNSDTTSATRRGRGRHVRGGVQAAPDTRKGEQFFSCANLTCLLGASPQSDQL